MWSRIIAVSLILFLIPVFLLIVIGIKLTSPGPVIYKAKRIGFDGRMFTLYKFRSMVVDAPMLVNGDFKTLVTTHDKRLTPIGRILRHGFDELPQLFNILKGDMHFIGPRPDPDWMLKHYTPTIRQRLAVLPGITGLAQICESSPPLKTAVGYALDLYYLENKTWVFDLWIIFSTLLYVLGLRFMGKRFSQRFYRHSKMDFTAFEPRVIP